MAELMEHSGLLIGLAIVLLLPVLLRSASARSNWAERVARERGWPAERRKAAADAPLGGAYLPFDTPASGDCGGGGGSGDCS